MAQGAWRSTAAPPPWSPGSLPRSRRPGAGADTASTSRSRDFSKAMTQILRHTAPSLGIEMRPDGFCKASDALASKPLSEFHATLEDLTSTVQNNHKQRFATATFDGELFVRAVQGHSIEAVDDGLPSRPRRPGAGADAASASRSVAISKGMTLILRHTAPSLGIEMRPDGFCKASDVLAAKPLSEFNTTVDDLTSTVQNNAKKRFATAVFDGELFVRAVQGHSIEAVDDGALLG